MKKIKKYNRGNRTNQGERYRKKYPSHIKAHKMVERLLRNKIIIKPIKCSKCNKYRTIHAHHSDYRNIFKFEWLCWECHNEAHIKIKAL